MNFKYQSWLGVGACSLVVACSSDGTPSASNVAGASGLPSAGAPSAGNGGTGVGGSSAGAGGTLAGGSGGAAAGSGGGVAGTVGTGGAGAGSAGAAGAAGAAGSACTTAPGKALQFDGSLVDLLSGDLGSDFPGGDVPRTIELWAKFQGAASWKAEGSMIETGLASGGGNKVFGIDLSGYSGTSAEFGPYTNGFSDNNHPNGVYVENTPEAGWLHLSWSYTGNHGTFSFTVNGVEYPIKTQAGMATLAFTPGYVTLGASQSFGTNGWSGVMDEIRLWSVAKTPAQIAADMKVVLKGSEAGLVAYYRLDEGSGDFVDDVSKKASHRLELCTSKSMRCAAVNAAKPKWVDSDVPGPFSCAP